MGSTANAFCSSTKQDLPDAYHCFLATVGPVSGTTANTVFTITALASTAGLSVGMAITGTGGIVAGSVIASIDSGTQVTMSKAATGTSTNISFTADVFKIALIIVTPTGTFGAATTNYSQLGTDELPTATGYTRPGLLLVNVSPGLTTTQAFWSFSPNPSWTSSTFSTQGSLIYNTSGRSGTTGKSVSVQDFAGTQTVSAGTFTIVLPSNAAGTAILQLN